MYFYADDYVKFCGNLRFYCNDCVLSFIDSNNSRHYEKLKEQGHADSIIGRLDDVEIVFLHYHSREEAFDKWNRRVKRINWDNIAIKFSQMNYAKYEHLKAIDELPFEKKVIFTTNDYPLINGVVFKEYEGEEQILDDTTHFRKYISLTKFINGLGVK